jgi:type VI secretion system secreted protein Hcp
MAYDAFLKLDGIEGESTNHKHKGEIEVLSFSWGISNSIGSATGGAGSGKSTVQDFSIVKFIDQASPILFQKCCEGESLGQGFFTLVDRGTGLGFYKIQFESVLISSLQPAASAGGSAAMEQLSFRFSMVDISASDLKGNTTSTIRCSMGGVNGQ